MKKRACDTDVECYKNYFLVAMKDISTGEEFEFSIFGEGTSFSKDERKLLRKTLTSYRHFTFNGTNYDSLMMAAATLGFTCRQLKSLSDDIIDGKKKNGDSKRRWDIEREWEFTVPGMDHIDLIEVAFGRASLKIYNGRVGGKRLQDLPFPPEKALTRGEADIVCDYCFNDLDATANLRKALKGQIELRNALSREHQIDLRSKSDAQVAEAIIRKEMVRLTGKCDKAQKDEWVIGTEFYYQPPKFIQFRSQKLKDLLELIKNTPFVIGNGGYVQLPEEIKAEKIRINEGVYTLGIGGIHSNEKSTTHIADGDYLLRDSDVTSYYPAIILALRLFPKQLGRTFLKIYEKIVKDRVYAKGQIKVWEEKLFGVNDPERIDEIKAEIKRWTIAADGGKIMVNGSFGKFGSKYSILYSPPLLIQTTITGQLSLMMLIEALEDIGIQVVSANTDGIISKIPTWMEDEYKQVLDWWQKTTGFNMEFTDYSGVYSRDVNSYIAITTKGKVKSKGAYSLGSMANNPQTEICIEAVIEHLKGTGSIIGTIKGCKDLRKFVCVRTVNGGAIWPVRRSEEPGENELFWHERHIPDGEYLGKAIRWYYAKDIDWAIHYKKPTKSGTHNKVPKTDGARPAMELPDFIKDGDKEYPPVPKDIDYAWYMRRSYDILEEIGLESDPTVKVKRTRKTTEEPAEDNEWITDKYGIVAGMKSQY